ncbi:hypothetical protein A9Q84_16425 [Halobacteriovorax marinus]|uniref:Uncharacterized protein n=1 Tax=Halobacteriovorax marinus TaxID=97084 RepID=A0A1Y5F4B9_9BACT|nr:hypothetical protein A9Q84_16425 [Halobacteriovorax marinus]
MKNTSGFILILKTVLYLSLLTLSQSYAQEQDDDSLGSFVSNIRENLKDGTDSLSEHKEKIERLSDEALYKLSKKSDKLKFKVANKIFDSISDRTLVEFENDDINGKLKIERKVFSNHDLINSYTVVDRLALPFFLPGWSQQIGSSHLNFSISSSLGIDFLNIRQVTASNALFENPFKASQKKKKKMLKSNWYMESIELLKEMKKNPEIIKGEQFIVERETIKDDKFLYLDAQKTARYSNFFNLLAFPLRIPLKNKWLHKLEDGEIISYAGTGHLSTGVTLGSSFDVLNPLDPLGASIHAKAYLRGRFQITILKESEDSVLVKFTKLRAAGDKNGFNIGVSNYDFFEYEAYGHSLLKLGTSSFKINRSVVDEIYKTTDHVYRYDLKTKEGIEAYEDATIGRFETSYAYSKKFRDMENAPVVRVAKAHKTGKTHRTNNKQELFIFLERKKESTHNHFTTQLTLSDGSKHIITASHVSNRFEEEDFWAEKNIRNYSFRTENHKDLQTNKEKFGFTFEGNFQDSQTKGLELNAYTQAIEVLFNQKSLFPEVPIYLPTPGTRWRKIHRKRKQINYKRMAKYGSSNFSFKVFLNEQQISSLINVDEQEMWSILEKSFRVKTGKWSNKSARTKSLYLSTIFGKVIGAPLLFTANLFSDGIDSEGHFRTPMDSAYITSVALNFHEKWMELKTKDLRVDKAEVTELIGEMFYDQSFNLELMRTILITQVGSELAYSIAGYNRAFGQIHKAGKQIVRIDTVTEEVTRLLNIEKDVELMKRDTGLVVAYIDSEIISDTKMKLKIKFNKTPKVIYFKLENSGGIKSKRVLSEFMMLNYQKDDSGELQPIFEGGIEKEIILDRENSRGFAKTLIDSMEADDWHTLSIAFSMTGKLFGNIVNQRIKSPDFPIEEELNDEEDEQ